MSLHEKRIVITRAAHQYSDLAALLQAEGAHPLPYPAIQLVPCAVDVWQPSINAAQNGAFDWVIFTSANTVALIAAQWGTVTWPTHTQVAAIGASTAQAITRHWPSIAVQWPTIHDAAHLLALLPLKRGQTAWLPQSELAHPAVHDGLTAAGLAVCAVSVYRVATGDGGVDLPALVSAQAVDALTFTSGSTVQHFCQRYADEGGHLPDLGALPLACLGSSAVNALHNVGLAPTLRTQTHSLTDLVTQLKGYFDAH
jgi:uroporphyrinogen-III synthase